MKPKPMAKAFTLSAELGGLIYASLWYLYTQTVQIPIICL